MNVRAVQATFDDLNPETRGDGPTPIRATGTRSGTRASSSRRMPEWRAHGLLGVHRQPAGRQPAGLLAGASRGKTRPSTPTASCGPDYMRPAGAASSTAPTSWGWSPSWAYFYFGQDERLKTRRRCSAPSINAIDWLSTADTATSWSRSTTSATSAYDHAILKPDAGPRADRAGEEHARGGRRLLVGTSYGGGTLADGERREGAPTSCCCTATGWTIRSASREMVRRRAQVPGYRPMPILFNEDDHFRLRRSRRTT